MKCKYCNAELIIPSDVQEGETVSCSQCGCSEYEYYHGELREIIIPEGFGWGE